MRSPMVELKDVHGSKEASAELIIGLDTVYVHSNVRKVTEAGPDGVVPDDLLYTMKSSTKKMNTSK